MAQTFPDNWSTTPGIYDDIPAEVYHNDRSATSNSLLSVIDQSPNQYRWRLNQPGEPTPPQRLGGLAHAMILEPHTVKACYWRVPEHSPTGAVQKRGSGKWWKEKWEPEAAGREMIMHSEWVRCAEMARVTQANDFWVWLLEGAVLERTYVWRDDEAFRAMVGQSIGGDAGKPSGMFLRCRMDIVRRHQGALYYADVKTAKKPFPRYFQRALDGYDYDCQAAFYWDGGRASGEDPKEFYFPVIQSEAPFETDHPYEFDQDAGLESGRRTYLRRLDKLAQCLERDEWPSFNDGRIRPISVSPWKLSRHQVSEEWPEYDDEEEIDAEAAVAMEELVARMAEGGQR